MIQQVPIIVKLNVLKLFCLKILQIYNDVIFPRPKLAHKTFTQHKRCSQIILGIIFLRTSLRDKR